MKKLKNILFGVLLTLLCLPFIQRYTRLFAVSDLYGAFIAPPPAERNLKNWFSGEFQEAYTAHFDYNIGFRPTFIRIHNQYLYSAYKKSSSYASAGRKGQLYAFDYWEAYRGFNSVGRDTVAHRYKQLCALQDSLRALGKPLLFVIAPNKVRLIPQYLMPHVESNPGEDTNYDLWLEYLRSGDIPYIDFNVYFKEVADTSTLDVFPSTGTHWNAYGMTLALDTILRRFDALKEGSALPHLEWDGIELRDSTLDSDRDLVGGLNLFFTLPTRPQPYPVNTRVVGAGYGQLPKTLIIGDSFFWGFFALRPLFNEIWHPDSRFWYYNQTQLDMGEGSRDSVATLNAHALLDRLDYILIIGTESNLSRMPYGFPEKYFAEKP